MADIKQWIASASSDKKEEIFLRSIADKVNLSITRHLPYSTKFLTPREQSLAEALLRHMGVSEIEFDGGYPEAERRILLIKSEFVESENPLTVVSIKKSSFDSLGHRDYLGSVLGLGITREPIGDIVMHEDGAYMIVLEEIADFLVNNLTKIGSKSVKLSRVSLDSIPSTSAEDAKTKRCTVPSLRLDVILSEAFKLSRSQASALISSGKVYVNSLECLKSDRAVSEGDTVTLRGKGKAKLTEISGTSKKGRIIITLSILG